MRLRARLLVVVILLAVVPTVAAGVYNYRATREAAEGALRAEAESRAAGAARRAESALRAHEAHLRHLAVGPVRAYVLQLQPGAPARAEGALPDEVRAAVEGLFTVGDGQLAAVSCLAKPGRPLFRATAPTAGPTPSGTVFQTSDFITNALRYDERVWSLRRHELARSAVAQEPYGRGVRTTVPVADLEERGGGAVGALVMETKLAALFAAAEAAAASSPERIVFVIDNASGLLLHHTKPMLGGQALSSVMPYFERAAPAGFYETPDGQRWLAASSPVEGLDVTVVAASNYAGAAALLRRAALVGVGLPAAAGALALLGVFVITGRAERRIGRVAEGAAAIAGGDLSRRVEVESSGETRVLAESFNLMGDRLRELIRRESEARQFESFMRLSAILTHDLKNSITGLSMLVSNMDRYYEREGFREDAVTGLRDATDKLRRIVARLSEPAKSLSGEYRRDARQTDLVPMINRVLAMNAVPAAPLYEIDARLPARLVATVEPERMENVVENLVINALEAMGARGGRLTVEAGEAEGGYVFLSVADTGPGMTEEFVRTQLYRPFSTTKTKGIGLGLYTCREVVEAHGGRLEVESRPGAGTRFRVVIPSALFTPRERRTQSTGDAPAPATPSTTSGDRRA